MTNQEYMRLWEYPACRHALIGISEALGECTSSEFSPDAIAERAVKVIKEWREKRAEVVTNAAQDALERLRGRCWSISADPDSIVNVAISELTRLRKIEAEKQPEPPKKAVYEWRGNELSRDGGIVGDIRLLTHIPFRVGRKAFSLEIHVSVSGQTESIPLAKAAVEAAVRAHYGDEA